MWQDARAHLLATAAVDPARDRAQHLAQNRRLARKRVLRTKKLLIGRYPMSLAKRIYYRDIAVTKS